MATTQVKVTAGDRRRIAVSAFTACGSAPPPASANLTTFQRRRACPRSRKPSRTTTSSPQTVESRRRDDQRRRGQRRRRLLLVEAKQGERITAELEGLRLRPHAFRSLPGDPGHERFELAASTIPRWSGRTASPRSSRRRTAVRHSDPRERRRRQWELPYRMHVGRFPRPTADSPAGGKPGETLEVQWLGDVAGERTER